MIQSPERSPAARRSRWSLVAGVATAVIAVVGVAITRPQPPTVPANRPLAPQQLELLHAERFHVDKPFQFTSRADRAAYQDGWLMVLAGDPELLRLRQVRQPVLFVGNQVASRINHGVGSGKLVVLVPGDFKVETAPIFFGGDTLPEELRQPAIDSELDAARAAGAKVPSGPALANAVREGVRTFADDYQLRLRAIELVALHAPDEQALIQSANLELVK